MQKIFYHNQVADITIGDEIFKGEIVEVSMSVNPKHDEIEYVRLPARESFSVSFTTKLDKSIDLSEWLYVKPYRQITIEFNGYITEKQKQGFRKLEEKGFIFFFQFKQKIYPKLIAEISFLTIFEIRAEGENVNL